MARVSYLPRSNSQPPPRRQDPRWWRNAVVYQIYPRSFADSDGDGIGDLAGITARLDYLAELGVGVVWLGPVYPSPQDDNGYDISDYCDIDPAFGTLADFDELVAGLHARGIRVMMDLVVNHTSDEHPWFQESRDPDSLRRNWYWWRPGRTQAAADAEPTNWRSVFGGPAWEFDERSGEYYLHLFSRKQPDLNWENPHVREAVYEVMEFWIDRGVDGFRMDVINMISKTLPLRDGPAGAADGATLSSDGPRMHEFLKEMHRRVLAGRNLLTVGEMPAVTTAEARRYTNPARGELDMVFTFEHVSLDGGATKWEPRALPLPRLKQNLADWQDALAEVGWNSLYWDNHDQPRAVSRFGDDSPRHRELSAKTLATVLHLHRGTPYVYQGEELGMTNAGFGSIEDYRDIESRNYYAEAVAGGAEPEAVLSRLAVRSRDNARTPMQWDAEAQAGFTTGTPWIAVNPNHTDINAAAQTSDPRSVYAHYRALIHLRRSDPTLVHGRFELLEPEHPQLWAFTRTLPERTLTVVANCSGTACVLPEALRAALDGEVVIATHHDDRAYATGLLRPWESIVVRS